MILVEEMILESDSTTFQPVWMKIFFIIHFFPLEKSGGFVFSIV